MELVRTTHARARTGGEVRAVDWRCPVFIGSAGIMSAIYALFIWAQSIGGPSACLAVICATKNRERRDR
jgi:hypothetical protein